MVLYERIKGKQLTVLGMEFGEKALHKVEKGQKMEKLNSRWDYGIIVGIRRRSDEITVTNQEGIIDARSVRRISVERRWSEDCVNWVRWAAWNKYRDAEDADGDVPEGVPTDEVRRLQGERIVFIESRGKAPRQFHTFQQDVIKYGHTSGCGGCTCWFY